MGRWIVIISLAMAQYADLAAAAPPLTGVPLPKPRPWRRAAPEVKTVPAPQAIRQGIESGDRDMRAGMSPAGTPPSEQTPATASQTSIPQASTPGEPAPEEPARGDLAPAPMKSGKAGDCNGGKRVISAYYWEGSKTASGAPFNPQGMTAAHRTLPFGTRLTVSNPRTGKSVVVVVNDRGPFVSGISLDLSLGAAQAIGMRGTEAVCI
jgi:rare lipoprotein A